MGRSSQRDWLNLALRLGGLVACLVLVSHLIDLGAATRAMITVPVSVTVLCVALVTLRVFVSALRWRALMPPTAGLSLGRLFRLIMAGGSVSIFLPGMVGADVARSLGAFREAASDRGEAAWSVVTDRIVGVGATLVVGLAACLVADDLESRWQVFGALGALLAVFMGIVAVVTSPRLHQRVIGLVGDRGRAGAWGAARLGEMFDAMRMLREQPRRLGSAFLASVFVQLIWFVVVWVVAQSLSIHIGFFGLAAASALVGILTSLPVTLGGIGVRELGFVYLLSSQGASDAAIGALALYQSALTVLFAVFGVPFLWAELVRRPRDDADPDQP